jgi:putative polyhydroxyalkanoate system protein
MPKFEMKVDHQLGLDAAAERLKSEAEEAKKKFAAQLSDLSEKWEGNEAHFELKVMGMKISGQVTVNDSDISIDAKLPMAAVMFRGLVEQQIRERLEKILA